MALCRRASGNTWKAPRQSEAATTSRLNVRNLPLAEIGCDEIAAG